MAIDEGESRVGPRRRKEGAGGGTGGATFEKPTSTPDVQSLARCRRRPENMNQRPPPTKPTADERINKAIVNARRRGRLLQPSAILRPVVSQSTDAATVTSRVHRWPACLGDV